MTLYFIDARGEMRLVKKDVEAETATKEISTYIKTLNPDYKIYYIRSWYSEDYGGTMYDIGSHVEFFLLVEQN